MADHIISVQTFRRGHRLYPDGRVITTRLVNDEAVVEETDLDGNSIELANE